MVNVLINTLKTFSPLRADAPEWNPIKDRFGMVTNDNEKRECSIKRVNN